MRPCKCDKCYVCWLWYNNETFRVYHGGSKGTIDAPKEVQKYGPDSIIEQEPVLNTKISNNVDLINNKILSGAARPNRCEFLLRRVEFKPGCGGWRCRHECEHKLPAVPGGYCQTCTFYLDSGDKF